MKKYISTLLNSENIASVLNLLAETPSKLQAASQAVPASSQRLPLADGERSLVEALAHLVNSEERTAEAVWTRPVGRDPFRRAARSARNPSIG